MNYAYANRAHQAYATNAVSTKSQGQLIIMLYDGAIKFIERAEQAILNHEIEEANTNIIKTQKIINELMVTLNLDCGEVATQLATMYQFIYQHLIQANIKKDLGLLNEAKSLIIELRETWKKII